MIYYLLSILVFFVFVAALIGMVLFICVLIDALTIWWQDKKDEAAATGRRWPGQWKEWS